MKPTLPARLRPRWETPDPRGVAGTYGDAVIEWGARELGIVAGPWQAYVLRKMLRHDKAGDLIHRTALISTGRQNGKSVVVRLLDGWMLDEGRTLEPFAGWTTILCAAHDAQQARIIYSSVLADISSIPRLQEQSHGRYPDVRLTEYRGVVVHGLKLDTVTSQPGSARGLSAGLISWDEMLTQEDWGMWEALSPTQSAQRSPLMVLTSTAGNVRSVVLRSFYDRLVRMASGDEPADPTFYGAWWQSRKADAGLDWRELLRANPSLDDGRLSRAAIKAEYAILPPDSWQRERLNHFVDVKAPGAFNLGVWAKLRTSGPLAGVDPPFYLGVDIAPGWERATIAAAAIRPDERMGVEIYRDIRSEDGTPLTAARVIAEIESFPEPVGGIMFDSVSGAAAAFERHGAGAWGLEWQSLKPSVVVSACMDATEMILSGRLAVDDPLLDAQIPLVARREIGSEGAFRFTRASSGGPIDAVMAMVFAVHGAVSAIPFPKIT